MEDSLIPVNIVVGDRTYRVRIESAHEEIVRKTVKVINDKLLEFKTNFAGKDMQDYIAMVVLWYATTAAETGGPAGAQQPSDQMDMLEGLLDKALI
jgi:cell division protein ZapA